MIRINVSRADATLTETETLTEGRVGLRCAFTFGEEWNGLQKIAYFEGSDARSVAMVDGDEVEVPWECLASAGYKLNVGVRGDNANGDTVIPTVWVRAGKIVPSPDSGIPEGEEPTPSVVAQIQQAAANALLIARDVAEQAESGAFKGDKGDTGEQGPRGETGDSGVYFGSTPPTDPDDMVWIDPNGPSYTPGAIDEELSSTSENPVQNKVITAALATKADQASIESTIPPIVNTWLGDNIAQETGYALDASLTMSNAAAPADKVGEVKSAVDDDEALLEKETITSVNKWNPDESVANTIIDNRQATYGELYPDNNFTTSGFIPANINDVVRWDYNSNVLQPGENLNRGETAYRIAEYDQNKSCLTISANWVALPYTVQNQNTAYIRLSVATRATNSIVFGDSSTARIQYVPYYSNTDFTRIKRIEDDAETTASYVSDLMLVDFETYSGYFSGDGRIGAASEAQEVHSNKFYVKHGDTLRIEITFATSVSIWFAYCLYDVNGSFLGRYVAYTGNGSECKVDFTIANTNAAYAAITYRTWGSATAVLLSSRRHTSRIPYDLFEIEAQKSYYEYAVALNQNVKSINHRGYCLVAPENTLPAYRLSREKGFKYVETDVSLTSDGVPVLLHDDTINRTARNADGSTISDTISIGSITYSQALTYDFGIWRGQQYAGTKIPTFAEFMALCRNLGLSPYIELKESANYTTAKIHQLVDIVREHGMKGKVTWISFAPSLLEVVKDYDPKARLGYVIGNPTDTEIATARSLMTETNEVFLDAYSYTDTECKRCSDNDIPLEVWTIDNASTIETINPYVTGITSDNMLAGRVLYDANN